MIDLDQIQIEIEEELGIKVGLRYKVIFYGRKREDGENKEIIRAVHIDLDSNQFSRNFSLYITKYGQSKTSFKNGRRMQF